MRNVWPAAKPTVTQLSDAMLQSFVAPRVRALLLSAFSALALVLAAIGIYGVTAHVTAQRTAEIGIRMALGARSPQVLAAVLQRIAEYAGLGLAIGMLTGIAGARLISAFLYGIGPGDFRAFVAAGSIAATIAIVAGWLPARRATRIDPTQALRAE